MSAAPIAVETHALTRRYGGIDVVRAVNVRIPVGARVALVGANGAGKTTLLAMLSTLVSPTLGSATVLGHDIGHNPAALRRSIGVLGHQPMVYEDLSPLENLQFFARLYDVPDAPARIEELLRAVGLWLRRRETTAVLSRGYHQRLALARALLHRPAVLLADEPETGLDPQGMALLDELALTLPGLTVLAATHRVDRVEAWATGLVRLERGRVVEDTVSLPVSAAGAGAAR
ncbi:MAG: ABC transporter ATP-binding protein [Chloroflexi bacterium]|nr:ABC transporter ATP-binding protein [Chloroflexota bacterium]MDA1240052.1 ABC transporter ATP-binding protein [Chloroflexota bacterium]